jgi:hypothetical protein
MNFAPRFGLILGSATILCLVPNVTAEAASFDFTTANPTSSSTLPVTVGNTTFTLFNPLWTSTPSVIDGIRQNSMGVCVWAKVGNSDTTGRCNVNPFNNVNYVGAELTGLTGVVDQASWLKSFTIGQFQETSTISNATINFKLGGTIIQSFNITGVDTYTFSSPILLAAGQNLEIITSGVSSDSVNGSAIRISTFDIDATVPGPLPLLGASAAFGWSRKIRRQIKRSVS